MIKFDLFQKLLEDPTYKRVTKDLSDEERQALEVYMKDFMTKMEEGVLAPFGLVATDKDAKEKAQSLLKKRFGKETLSSTMSKK